MASRGTSSFTNAIYFVYYASIILITDSCQCLAGLFNTLAYCFTTYFIINSSIVLCKLSIILISLKAGFCNTSSIQLTILYIA
jgi:hypothetical protein